MSIELFVPGRLCLFGEHSDWAGKYRAMNAEILPGAAIVTGVEQGIYAHAEKSEQFEIDDFSCQMKGERLSEIAKSDSFYAYCAGVASYMLEWHKVGGIRITIDKMTLPMKKGLSSSAAICVLVARAFNHLYKLNLNTLEEMNAAYQGELRTASRCGRLDQACAFGVKPVLMHFDCEDISVDQIIVKEPLHWVFADLNAGKNTIKILRDLNKAYPFASSEEELLEHEALGIKNQDIIKRAIAYMGEGEKEKLGELMTEAQTLFDAQIAPLCPEELKSPKLHSVLADTKVKSLTFGGKGVGSQGDGSIQFLAKDSDSQRQLVEYLESQGMKAFPLTIKPRHSVRKAIIPVAGFGTRLYPETKLVKKDFFPIVDKDGFVKPVILLLLEDLIASGIEEICIILGSEEERRTYADFFEKELPQEHLDKLSDKARAMEQHILSIGSHLNFVYQKEKKGFGHAVYQAAEFAGGDNILLILGDTIYRSNNEKPCSLQLIEAFENSFKPIISVHETPLGDVSYYGIVSGKWTDSREKVLDMSAFIEKPTAAYAEENLGVGLRDGSTKYYSVFGQYVLTPEVFEQLRQDIADSDSTQEIGLTEALEKIRASMGMQAVILDGNMYDIGNPTALKETYRLF